MKNIILILFILGITACVPTTPVNNSTCDVCEPEIIYQNQTVYVYINNTEYVPYYINNTYYLPYYVNNTYYVDRNVTIVVEHNITVNNTYYIEHNVTVNNTYYLPYPQPLNTTLINTSQCMSWYDNKSSATQTFCFSSTNALDNQRIKGCLAGQKIIGYCP